MGHAWFQADFPEGECDTLFECVSFTLNFGMRAGGGLGDVLEGGDGASKGFGRMVIQLVWFVSVAVDCVLCGYLTDS